MASLTLSKNARLSNIFFLVRPHNQWKLFFCCLMLSHDIQKAIIKDLLSISQKKKLNDGISTQENRTKT